MSSARRSEDRQAVQDRPEESSGATDLQAPTSRPEPLAWKLNFLVIHYVGRLRDQFGRLSQGGPGPPINAYSQPRPGRRWVPCESSRAR